MIRAPRFIATKSGVAAFCSRLSLLQRRDWSVIYLDPTTSEEWTCYPMWDYHGPRPECLRRGTPNLEETLEAIEHGEDDAEVAAASFYVVNELTGGRENLHPLVEHLEHLLHRDKETFSRKVALALAWSQADKTLNTRDPTGKPYAEVSADYEHFKAISARAMALRSATEQVCGKVAQDSAVFA
jgi:hypothetical protein